MTAPLLATRDALARGICDYHNADSGRDDDEAYPCWSCSAQADHLIASGVVMSERNHELIEAVTNALWKLDGSTLAAVALVTGFSLDDLRNLGGLRDDA